ncbi:MAG: preprotein translocase subunit YajC [Defluviitaleaceae bacterium]|nr:preprotein translocase subunit YajC [Defluviitaleaceae bacterium]
MAEWVIATHLIDDMFPGGGPTENVGGEQVISETGTPAYVPEPESPGFFGTWGVLVLWAVVFGGMWFFLIRPQRNREKKVKEMQAQISTGDNIVTSGGLFGQIADVGDDCFIVEFGTNRSLRIPVLKSDVVGVRAPKMTPQPKEMPKELPKEGE